MTDEQVLEKLNKMYPSDTWLKCEGDAGEYWTANGPGDRVVIAEFVPFAWCLMGRDGPRQAFEDVTGACAKCGDTTALDSATFEIGPNGNPCCPVCKHEG